MKKLIISIVATASLALVAKADVAPLNATSFEDYVGDFTVDTSEGGEYYWSGGNEGQFEFIEVAAEAKTLRPKYWADQTNVPDTKALSIDTDVALSRHVATKDAEAQNIGNGLYFDSMVQFTATDTAPTPTDGDKLIVWLKEIPSEEEGGQPTYKLCVTAAELDDDFLPKADPMICETSETIEPNSWHRLSIAANVETAQGRPNLTVFKVYLDSNEIVTDKPFYSLVPYTTEYNSEDEVFYNRISSVSFQGKGAIDDLVWTTEDPNALVSVSVTWDGIDNIQAAWGLPDDKDPKSEEFPIVASIGQTIRIACTLPDGYSVKHGDKSFTQGDVFGGYEWYYDVEITSDLTSLTFTITQDAKPVAKIGDVTYTSLTDALAAAQADETIKLLANIATDAAFVVTKTVAIDLNGMIVSATENDTEGNGVFWVQQGGVLTIDGNGTVNGVGGNNYNIAIWADGGRVIIEGGTYTNVGAKDDGPDRNHFDLIYAKNGGSVEINGGTFICQTPRWTLNKHNTTTGTFVVKGGMFYDYDPSNINTDDQPVTSWCPAGYEATLDTETGYYTVAEKTIEPVTPGESATVEAKTEDDALAKVKLSVTVPEAFKGEVSDEVYKGYFELKATEASSGTWIVEAVLKDEVKPVIEATTDKEGVVTPAISFGTDGTVTINISNELPGLYYGVKYATTVGGVETAEIIPDLTVTPKEGDTAGFFRVVVDFKEIPAPAADAE